jgi:hypothetical protein
VRAHVDTRPKRLARAAVVVAALGALALTALGCGGDDKSDADQVKDVVADFYAALADGDGAQACDLVTGSAKAQVSAGQESCEESVSQAAKRVDDELKEELRSIEIRDIKVEGKEATCTATANRVARVELKKQGDDWKITDY